nr:hypothetical protein [Solimonas terrae]
MFTELAIETSAGGNADQEAQLVGTEMLVDGALQILFQRIDARHQQAGLVLEELLRAFVLTQRIGKQLQARSPPIAHFMQTHLLRAAESSQVLRPQEVARLVEAEAQIAELDFGHAISHAQAPELQRRTGSRTEHKMKTLRRHSEPDVEHLQQPERRDVVQIVDDDEDIAIFVEQVVDQGRDQRAPRLSARTSVSLQGLGIDIHFGLHQAFDQVFDHQIVTVVGRRVVPGDLGALQRKTLAPLREQHGLSAAGRPGHQCQAAAALALQPLQQRLTRHRRTADARRSEFRPDQRQIAVNHVRLLSSTSSASSAFFGSFDIAGLQTTNRVLQRRREAGSPELQETVTAAGRHTYGEGSVQMPASPPSGDLSRRARPYCNNGRGVSPTAAWGRRAIRRRNGCAERDAGDRIPHEMVGDRFRAPAQTADGAHLRIVPRIFDVVAARTRRVPARVRCVRNGSNRSEGSRSPEPATEGEQA